MSRLAGGFNTRDEVLPSLTKKFWLSLQIEGWSCHAKNRSRRNNQCQVFMGTGGEAESSDEIRSSKNISLGREEGVLTHSTL